MKKQIKFICLIIICMFINIVEAHAEKYIYYGYVGTNTFEKTTGPGTNFYYSDYYITLDKKNKKFTGTVYTDTGSKFDYFGGQESLLNMSSDDDYPYFIVVDNVEAHEWALAPNIKWYGSSSDKCIESNEKDKKKCSDKDFGTSSGDYVFILESYYKQNNKAPEKKCIYIKEDKDDYDFHDFAIIKDNGDIKVVHDPEYYVHVEQSVLDKVANNDVCPNVTFCNVEDLQANDAGVEPDNFYVFNDDLSAKDFGVCKNFYWFKDHDVEIDGTLDQDKEDTCDTYDSLLGEFEKNYKSCKENLTNCGKAKENEEKIKKLCNLIAQTQNYNTSPCLRTCLNLSNDISNIKQISVDTSACGFSGRLLAWISNILRWAKYILPVLVMVLGILDFMKAMGADKEDEMKKAQGRFVKRLIAAALVFLIPLILEFVLDKMGFGYDSCGLF